MIEFLLNTQLNSYVILKSILGRWNILNNKLVAAQKFHSSTIISAKTKRGKAKKNMA